MSKKFADKHSDDPNALTTEDREVLKKKTIAPGDVADPLSDDNALPSIVPGMRLIESAPKLIMAILLVVSGILIAVLTSLTIVGIILGALFVIGGIILPFTNLGAGRRRHTA